MRNSVAAIGSIATRRRRSASRPQGPFHRYDGEGPHPNSQFVGCDFHPSAIEHAAAHARRHGVAANTRLQVATAKEYPQKDFDLVAFFDCLYDMADPAGAAAHVRQLLKRYGSWMIVELTAGDKLGERSSAPAVSGLTRPKGG
jgi:2-polyprenyl-3-methyl-5-hydroxy-6-metoxy-1,4-benzoquinol methylase